jgi:hypothetical protein
MQKIDRNDTSDAGVWSVAFHANPNNVEFARLLHILSVRGRDIYTSRLSHTVSLFGALQGGRVEILRRGRTDIDFTDVLHVLSVVLTYSRLARTRVAKIVEPGFYVKVKGGALRPAMPVSHLASIAGISRDDLSAILAPLAQDGALRVLTGSDGSEAVVVSDGFTDDTEARRFMKF